MASGKNIGQCTIDRAAEDAFIDAVKEYKALLSPVDWGEDMEVLEGELELSDEDIRLRIIAHGGMCKYVAAWRQSPSEINQKKIRLEKEYSVSDFQGRRHAAYGESHYRQRSLNGEEIWERVPSVLAEQIRSANEVAQQGNIEPLRQTIADDMAAREEQWQFEESLEGVAGWVFTYKRYGEIMPILVGDEGFEPPTLSV